ncbi:unnamed protein product [Polarella glacialis]|uniref:Reverse transcriptase domain-containing protein n=1 Tax=Polarella glacialis TaxID=89957 RepID=A0A813HIA5_POLGL|nr:unnamed protein product [Polarella glacialis]
MLSQWDFILIQEGFRRLDGISTGEHVLFTPPELCGGLRCPAIFVHSRWTGEVRMAGGGSRWVAVDFQGEMLLISAHLPCKRRTLLELETTLEEIQAVIAAHPEHKVVLGVDANTKLNGTVDYQHVGAQVPRAVLTAAERERAKAVHTFTAEGGLMVANTWMGGDTDDQWFTRTNWDGEGPAQIDYIMTSMAVKVENIWIEKHTWFNSDHRALVCRWATGKGPKQPRSSAQSLRAWAPGPEWCDAVRERVTDWSNWDTTAAQLRDTAVLHGRARRKEVDLELEALQLKRKEASLNIMERQILNRSIWRRRRFLKRARRLGELEECADAGRAPRLQKTQQTKHYNWAKIAGQREPRALLTEFYSEIHGLPEDERQDAREQRPRWIALGRELQGSESSPLVPRAKLDKALGKLKKGKGSPDGLTAEVLQELPDDCKDKLAADLSHRCAILELPREWCRSLTTLAPKILGATSLAKFRPIAGLCAMRKLLGYIWIWSLPLLAFTSVQTAFVPGSHADTGVFMINRAAELSREWRVPLVLAQLDVKKAFDHVDHRAAFEAMRLQGISLHAIALIAAIWACSVVTVRLGMVSSDDIPMDRGLPQGAPESPLIFTMIMDMVIRALEPQWREKGYGFSIDRFRLTAVCYADDIVLAASSKEHLEAMISDVINALGKIGLGVGAEKTHWTSTPQMPEEALRVEAEEVAWEDSLTFVGTVVDLSGNAGPAILYRMAQANKAFAKWKEVLTCSWIPKAQHIKLLPKSVWSSLLWSSSTWTTTKVQRTGLDSWSARLVSRVARTRRAPSMDDGQWWRFMHRTGHRLIAKFGISVAARAQQRVLRWAGHVARLAPETPAATALRCRGLQWWRWRQAAHKMTGDKWSGPHPRRFKIRRWEEQLADRHGEGFSECTDHNTGWLLKAQDREWWHKASAI